jgi:hypothetical protein
MQHSFPVLRANRAEFLWSTLPEEDRILLKEVDRKFPRVIDHAWRPSLVIRYIERDPVDEFYRTKISVSFEDVDKMPKIPYVLDEDHPDQSAIVTWAEKQLATQLRVEEVGSYFRRGIQNCSTAGQIKRIFPELVEILPDYIKTTLGDAVRSSRWPISWEQAEDHGVKMSYLAYCSLLPTKEGLWVPRVDVDNVRK